MATGHVHPLDPPVLEVLDSVDPDDPVFGGIGLLQYIQLEIFVSYLRISHPVIPTGLPWERSHDPVRDHMTDHMTQGSPCSVYTSPKR